MIPLRDINPRHTFPFVTVLLIAANVLVFAYQVSLPERPERAFLMRYAMFPAVLGEELGRANLPAAFLPLLTSMFLHGGVFHILGNMWFLWVFGDNVEDRMGRLRYLVFYLLCGIGAGLAHVAFNTNSQVPTVGASGAISGVLGAYLVLFPGKRVVTLIPLGWFLFTANVPAMVILGYWFVIQFASGVVSLGGRDGPGVAWWAHIGGFVLGMVWVKVFERRRPRPTVEFLE